MEWLTELEELFFLLSEDISVQVIDPISIYISVTSFEFLLLKIPWRKCLDIFLVMFIDTQTVT